GVGGGRGPVDQRGGARPGGAASGAGDARRGFWLGPEKKRQRSRGARDRRSRPGARQPLGRSEGAAAGPPSSPSGNPIWSVATSTPLDGVFGERAANRGWRPWFLRNLPSRHHHRYAPGDTSRVTEPKHTAKPDQRHRQGKREIIGLMAGAVTVSQDRI